MESRKRLISTRTIAFASTFAALYAILRILPTFPMLGVSGSSFAAADIVAPLYGIILGPIIGPLSIIIGTAIGFFGKPPVFLGLDFLPAVMNALLIGLLMRGKWVASVGIYAIILAVFISNPLSLPFVDLGGTQIPFHWMHIVALALLISPLGRKSAKWITDSSLIKSILGLVTLAFIGSFIQHSTGGLLWETIFGNILGIIPPNAFAEIWQAIFWIYPGERIFLILITSIVGIATIKGLNSAGLLLTKKDKYITTNR